ncbi:uncharacterized protein LOC130809859 isoform X1 [Amaranthus tricolor]|uniref:uncharacterized protein LOC130809859 isoform X1 n=1 Tax=Amaranthus tricolor TaxID=29722 RepID=UPI002583561C|nr:uncharacterized protein LOC130809859 isoform X1 [Amaranthus tricolor]
MSRKKVVVIGGTGYLGQHLLEAFSDLQSSPFSYDLAFTYHSNPPSNLLHAFPQSLSFLVDLQNGNGFDSISTIFGQPDVVVNCAAVSVPRACEVDPVAAMSVNVPTSVVNWLLSFKEKETLLIHLSTDQVYEGTKSFYKEEDETMPVNVYGRSKLEAEKFITAKFSNFAILRSSIIYGPQTVSPVPKSLPIQWIDDVLSKGNKVDFFYDEYRCPVFVKDVVAVIISLTMKWVTEARPVKLLLNLGGPDRVSRVQMAKAVAESRGYDTSLINSVSASSVDRGVKSPADISMDIDKLVKTLNISPISFKEGVKLTLNIP